MSNSFVEDRLPLVSIITITYNAAQVVTPTMESVAEQTCRDFEHLIIDGASTDPTLDIARSIGGRSLRILSERDRGIYDAMNKGLKMARGRYLLFLNAGDAFHSPETLDLYVRAIRAMKDDEGIWPDVVYADTVVVDDRRRVLRPRHLSAPERLTFESYRRGMLVCHQAFMVRADLAPKYDLSWRFSADYEWTLRILRNTDPERCINLRAVAIDYLSDGTTDRNHRASLLERFRIMCRYYGVGTTLLQHARMVVEKL